MDATLSVRSVRVDVSREDDGPQARRSPANEPACALHLEREAGPRGENWAVNDDAGQRVYSLGRRNGGMRIGVRDCEDTEQASLGRPVLSLVENYAIWRGGRPYARVYRPAGGAHRGRWFVEVGEREGWVVLTDRTGLRVLSGGVQVARVGCRDALGMPTCVELATCIDAPLVLLLAEVLYAREGPDQ